jgi:hypothetical protein
VALLALALAALAGQACSPSKPAETAGNCEAAVKALRMLYERAAESAIKSGACDAYSRVEDCPAYALIEAHYQLASEGVCPSNR